MEASDLLTLVLSSLALAVSLLSALRQLRLAKQANTLPVLIDLFREHRGPELSAARSWVGNNLSGLDVSQGSVGMPTDEVQMIHDLAWYYDNLGALVAHGVVDIGPVAGYLGGSVIEMWERMQPFIEAERSRRSAFAADPARWQAYFENLYLAVKDPGPAVYRERASVWHLPAG